MEDKQKILYLITQGEQGGAQKYVLDLAARLPRGKFVVTIAYGEQKKSWLRGQAKNLGISTHYIKHLKRKISPFYDLLAFFELYHFFISHNFDIVHANSSKAGILGSLAAKAAMVPRIIYTAHGWVFNEPLPAKQKRIYFWAEKISAAAKDRIICVSDYDREVALKYGFKRQKLTTIHNGIDTTSTTFLSREKARSALGATCALTKTKRSLATIANFYPTKGLIYLLQAVKQLSQPPGKEKKNQYSLCIFGAGKLHDELQEFIEKNKLSHTVRLVAGMRNASSFLPAFDLFVIPSLKEGYPYTILEAQATGLPIVATNVGGVPEALSFYPETHFRIVPPKDSYALANAIKDIAAMPPLTEKELNKIKGRIDIKEMIEKTFSLYSPPSRTAAQQRITHH